MSTKLLIDERPLQVLPSLVKLVGMERATILQQIHWLTQLPNSGVVHDGHKWIWGTHEEWCNEHFPFWKPDTLRKHLVRLEKDGFIVSTQLKKGEWDRTKYYRVNYEKLSASNSHDHATSNRHDHATSNRHDHATSNPHDHATSNPHDHATSNPHDHATSNSDDHATSNSHDYADSYKEQKTTAKTTTKTTAKRVVGASAPTAPPLPEWEKWVGALCWVCHGHMEPDSLTEKELGALLAEAKRLRDAGRADCDMLKRWFLEVWKSDWRWQKGEQRPNLSQVRSGLAAYAQARVEQAQLMEELARHRNDPPQPTAPTVPDYDDPWAVALQDLVQSNQMPDGVLERARAEVVGDYSETEVWQVTLNPVDAPEFTWMQERGAVLIRKTLTSILQRAVTVIVVLPEREAA